MLVCLHGWRRVVCMLDEALHALRPTAPCGRVCDWHDNLLMREMGEV